MTYSYAIRNGDLSLAGPQGFATVSGGQKLAQDLKNWILEPRGTDPMHPDYGSLLGGGYSSDGRYIDTIIGGTITPDLILDIQAEIRRVLVAYQQQQYARMSAEFTATGNTTLTPGEILDSVNSIDVHQSADTVIVNVAVQTQSGNVVTFAQPLTG